MRDYEAEQRFIYTEAILLQAKIELEGMIAENQMREHLGQSPAYVEADFISLRDRFITMAFSQIFMVVNSNEKEKSN